MHKAGTAANVTAAVCFKAFLSSQVQLKKERHCRVLTLLLRDAQAAAAPVAPADPEDDIFGDAGKAYEAALPPPPRPPAGGAAAFGKGPGAPQKGAAPGVCAPGAAGRGSYFNSVDDMRDLPALPKPGAPIAVPVLAVKADPGSYGACLGQQ